MCILFSLFLEDIILETRNDYSIIFTGLLSRIHTLCVSNTIINILQCLIFTFEFGSYVLICMLLAKIVHKPLFEFDLNNIIWNRDDGCPHGKNVLNKIYKYSNLLLPLSATLLSVGFFWCCCLCKPFKGVIIGGIFRYPFIITLIVYTYLIYIRYYNILTYNCIDINSFEYSNIINRITNLKDFIFKIFIFEIIIISLLLPTLCIVYVIIYYIFKMIYTIFKCIIKYYIILINKIICCNCVYKCLLCCCWENEYNNNINNNIRIRRNKNNLTIKQRKNITSKYMKNGDCCICFETNIPLIVTRGCMHGSCVTCFYSYIINDIKDTSKYPRRCFGHKCQMLINYIDVEYVLTRDELDIYDQISIKAATSNKNDFFTCPKCQISMIKPKYNNNNNNNNNNDSDSDNDNEILLMQCLNPNCNTDLCIKCESLWHINKTCHEYQTELKQKTLKEDKAFEELMKKEKWIKCPNCEIPIQRTEGCYHITHYGCLKSNNDNNRTDFCFFCGELLMKKDGHGWRYGINGSKHFINGVYEPCIHSDTNNDDINTEIDIHIL